VAAAFIGPGTITMCSIAGAQFKYGLIWALIVSILLTMFIQLTAIRIGLTIKCGDTLLIQSSIHFETPPYCEFPWV